MKRMAMITFLLISCLTLTAPSGVTRLNISAGKVLFDKNELNWYSIDYWLRVYDVQEPEAVKLQIRLETGNLTSRYCLQDNNLFGMKYPRKRQTTAIKRNKSMAVYRTWHESIKDYAIWQSYFYKGGDYFEFLKSHGYATDKGYIQKLKTLTD